MLASPKTTTDKLPPPIIILTGGGSGGHITPILSLAHALKQLQPRCQLIYVGLKAEKVTGLAEKFSLFDQQFFISAGKYRRYHGRSRLSQLLDIKQLALNTRDLFKVFIGLVQARRLLKKIKPDVVFSKGGYVAVPVGIAAHRLHIPIVTHDSDSVPGLANRIIGRWAVLHATGQPTELYDYPKDRSRFTGIPLGLEIKPVSAQDQARLKARLGLAEDDLALLVSGGGLGSRTINDLMVEVVSWLLNRYPKLHIFHITGDLHQAGQAKAYDSKLTGDLRRRVEVHGFVPDFFVYSGAADVIVTRAGATSLAEFAVQKKACLVMPSPWLTSGHQLKNAEALAEAGAVQVIDNDISPPDFQTQIDKLLADKHRRQLLADKLGKTAKPGAARLLARTILEVVETTKS